MERIDDLGNDLKLIQNDKYFCFGTDSVLLANFVKSNKKINLLDLCSGSGIIPILLTKKININTSYAIELQDEMYDLLIKNNKLNNLNINCIKEDITNINNILSYIKDNIDVITVNPPYKEKGSGIYNKLDVKYIARHEEKLKLDDIFKLSSKLLNDKSKLYIVHKPERINDLISIARKYNLEAKTIQLIQPTINKKPSIVLIEYTKNGGKETKINPVLVQYDDNNNYTTEFLKFVNEK
ncbi:MAG: methyltransferase [Clostridia bacterium]